MAAKEFTVPLRLTSPLTRGQKVKDAQWLLAGNNRFTDLAPYKDGKLDGIYGPLAAHATSRAKFWTGYPLGSCDHTFGQTLYEYLRPNHWRELPHDYQVRRAARIAEAIKTPGELAFAEALKFVGYKETPVNRTIFGEWYRMNGEPWCAIFESYCFAHSSKPYSFRYSYVPQIWQDARAGRNGLHVVYTPRHGDIVCYDWGSETLAHTEFYDQRIDGNTFRALGGNTGSTSFGNGGEVLRTVRYANQVHGFVRVG